MADARVRRASREAVTAGKTYTALASFRAATTGRSSRILIRWYDAASGGTLLSTTTGVSVTSVTTGWIRAAATGAAPGGATHAELVLEILSAAEIEDHYVDAIALIPHAADASVPITSGLVLWLKADAITGLADGAAVGTWADSSSAGNNATQATAAKKPTYRTNVINGKPVVRFDGGDDGLDLATNLTQQVGTFCIVATKAAGGGYQAIIAADDQIAFARFASPDEWGVGTTLDHASGVALGTTPMVMVADRRAVNDIDLVSNGSVKTVTTGTGNPDRGASSVGYNTLTGANFLNGDIAEVLFYDRALSASERELVEGYLARKYAIPEATPWTRGGLMSSQKFAVEYSDDNETTWSTVRSASSLSPDSAANQAATVQDYEAPPNTARKYRAKTSATV